MWSGGGDADGVDLVVHLEQHLAEVFIAFGFGEFFEDLFDAVQAPIDVAQGHDISAAVGGVNNVGMAFAVKSDLGHPDLGPLDQRTRPPGRWELRNFNSRATGQAQHRGGRGGQLQEFAA